MNSLSIVVTNKDRLDPKSLSTQWFIKSLKWQDSNGFSILVVDGGSKNFDELANYIRSKNDKGTVPIELIQHKTTDKFFHKTLLNNVGIRRSSGDYIMTTDADILFGKSFITRLYSKLKYDVFLESRVMYWKSSAVKKIYSGELDPYDDLDSCKIGRIKKRTTPGACQCTYKDNWHVLRGYDEKYIGWGSEDMDLLMRAGILGLKTIWLGETTEDIMLFHQPHDKNIKRELEEQELNKARLNSIKSYRVNPSGWGAIKD